MDENIKKANRWIKDCLKTKSISLDLSALNIKNISQISSLKKCIHLKSLNLKKGILQNIEKSDEKYSGDLYLICGF